MEIARHMRMVGIGSIGFLEGKNKFISIYDKHILCIKLTQIKSLT